MGLREQLLEASKKASEVHAGAQTRRRIEQDGYCRIDPISLAEQAGVAVMVRELDQLLGAFIREEQPGILLNSERPIGMVHMTCAHELGHFYLGHLTTADEDISYGDKSDPREQEANAFATSLLSPRWLVLHALSAKGWRSSDLTNPIVVYQLSLRLGVSFTAMVWTLARYNFLTRGAANAMAKLSPKSVKERLLPQGAATTTNTDVWLLDQRDKNWIIEPRVQDQFVVRLPSHATAGFLWSSQEVAREGFALRPVLVDARTVNRPEGPTLVGGSEEDVYVLDASDVKVDGQHRKQNVHLVETRPWDSAAGATGEEVTLPLQFELLRHGLSDGTRDRAFKEQ
jgi:Zn-dependent peptidase ImmA (M78 family)